MFGHGCAKAIQWVRGDLARMRLEPKAAAAVVAGNPGNTWIRYPGLGTLTTGNPGIHGLGTLA